MGKNKEMNFVGQPVLKQIMEIEETLRVLDDLVQSGKVRYIAAPNFSGWHLMKSQAVSEKYGWNRYVGHQVYYSLAHREYEWELMPLALDQKIGALVPDGFEHHYRCPE